MDKGDFDRSNPKVESIVWDKRASNCSIIENIPPKGVSFSDFAQVLKNLINYSVAELRK